MSSPHILPPAHVRVLVIGGGPAGSYAAAALAREGVSVALFEASRFPRYHVGESLIPSVRHYLRFIGAEDKLASHGFVPKPGSAIKFNQHKREGYTDFVALGHDNNAWNVVRAEFDQLLLNHARSCGARVFEQTKVAGLTFSPTGRPLSASWTHTPPPTTLPSPPTTPTRSGAGPSAPRGAATVSGTTTFDYVVDASGRAGIISTQYLKNRRFNEALKNVAVWGYWKGVGSYGVGTQREGAPWFEALTDESGWAWFIPLHNGTTSVGVVMNQGMYNASGERPLRASPFSAAATACYPGGPSTSTAHRYLSNLASVPGLVKLIGAGVLQAASVKSASDFSYSAPTYAGEGYRIVGDAGAFIDPFFSSGVHLALTSALAAAASICAGLRGDCAERAAAAWHTSRVSTSYTRFQVVVLSAYKQIRAQHVSVLADIDEDNYDRAFAFLRPVIQGAADVGARLSENELQRSLDFCGRLFGPTAPEEHEALRRTVPGSLLDVHAPVVSPALCAAVAAGAGKEHGAPAQAVLDKVNARRVVHAEYGLHNLEAEALDGLVVRLERGRLGLVEA